MKLRLPLLLLSSLLACFTSSSFASTDLGGSAYSGGIYTWVGSGSTNFHDGGWSQTTMNEGNLSYGAINTNWGSAATVGSIQNLFCNNALSEYNTVRFVAEGTAIGENGSVSANKQIVVTFAPLNIGGLLVEAGATGYAINSNANNRGLVIGKNATAVSLFTVQEDFTMQMGMSTLNGTGNWMIASGKTLSFERTTALGGNTNVLTLAAGSNLNITGGGTVSLTGLAGTGAIHLNASKLALTTTAAATLSNALQVTGASELSMGADMIWGSVAMNNAASLKMSRSLIINGNLHLKGASASIDGSLTLGTGSTLNVGVLPSANASLLTVSGVLTLGDALLIYSDPSIVWVAGNSYDLISANSISGTLSPNQTFLLSDSVCGQWAMDLNKLLFTTHQITEWNWVGGGNSTWGLGGLTADSPWLDQGVYSNLGKVIFGDVEGSEGLQEVSISGVVAPLSINVNATTTNYLWTGEEGSSLSGAGSMEKSGAGELAIETNNSTYSGKITISDGALEMRHANALGTGDLFFNGGVLKYGTGITTDVSGRIKKVDGLTNLIKVNTNGENVAWGSLADKSLSITKSGAGNLSLTGGAYTGKLTNEAGGGMFAVNGASNLGGTGGLSGIIHKTGAGIMVLQRSAFNASSGATLVVDEGTLELSDRGVYSGTLNITLGRATVFNVASANAWFSGTGTLTMGAESRLILKNGNGDNGGPFFMNMVLDAAGSFVSIDGAVFGNASYIDKAITGVGDLRIVYNQGGNTMSMRGGWVANSYQGNTEIGHRDSNNSIGFNYDGTGATTSNGQTLTPWGTGNVTIGGIASQTTQVNFTNLNTAYDYKLDGAIALVAANGGQAIVNLFTAQTGEMTLNGQLSVATAGTGAARLNAGKKLNLTKGLAGDGTLTLNTTSGGTLTLGGDSSSFTGTVNITNAAQVVLAGTTAIGGTIVTSGGVSVKGKQQVNNLTLGSLYFDGAGLSAGSNALTANSLSVGAEAALFINLDSDVTLGSSYGLVEWTTLTGTFASSVTLTGNFSDIYDASLSTGGNSLSVIFRTKADLLFWDGVTDSQWSQGGGNWSESGVSVNFDTGDKVVFKNSGLVNITGDVEPGSILFVNGENTTLTLEGAGKIKGAGVIKVSSLGTVVMATDNSAYSGEVVLSKGVLEIKNANALGSASTANITFEGGLLKYGSGITTDLSTRAKGNVSLDLNGNNVNWLVKTGNTQTDIKEIHLKDSSGAATTLTTKVLPTDKISLAANTTLKLEVQTGVAYSAVGSVSGDGTMHLSGGASVFAAAQNYLRFTSTTDFTGTWVFDKFLIKEGLNLTALGGKKIVFNDCASAETRVFMGLSANISISQDIELLGTGLTLTDGSSAGVITFNGAFTGSGAFTKSNNTVGDVYKFLGNMSGYTGNVSYHHQNPGNADSDRGLVFGGGSIAQGSDIVKIAGTGNIAITGTSLAYLTFNYGADDATAVNALSGMGVLTKQGAGKLILAKGSGMTEAMTLEGTLQLGVGSEDTAAVIAASSIVNNGTLVLNFSGKAGNETIMSQNITTTAGQTGNLVKDGADTVTLGGTNTYNGTTTVKNGVLQLVRDNTAALGTSKILVEGGILNMSGTALTNELSLTGGSILNAGMYGGVDHSVTITDSTAGASQTSICLGNIAAGKIKSLHLEKVGMSVTKLGSPQGNSQLTLENSTLTFGASNMLHALTDPYPNSPSALIQFENGLGSTVSMTAGSVLTLDLMDADLIVKMQEAGAGTQTFYLLLTNGKLNGITEQDLNFVAPVDTFDFVAIDGGNVVISGDTSNIYAVASNQEKTIDSNVGLDAYHNALVNGTLNLNLPGVGDPSDGIEIKNLSGKQNAVINVTSTGGGSASVILDVADTLKETYLGSINGGSANLTKTGEGTQVIGGAVTTTGNMSITAGVLELNGLAKFGNLTTDTGSLIIGKAGETILSGAASSLNAGTSISGEGKLTLNDNARLTLAAGSKLDGVNVKLDGAGSALDLGSTIENKISGLNGKGSLIGNGAELAIQTAAGQMNEYSGVLAGSGVMTIDGTGDQKLVGAGSNTWDLNLNGGNLHLLVGANSPSISYKSLDVTSGTVRISASGTTQQDVNPSVTLANGGSFASGSTLAFDINTDYLGALTPSASPLLRTEGLLTLADGVNIDVTSLDPKAMIPAGVDASFSILLAQSIGTGDIELEGGLNLQTSGFFKVYFTDAVIDLIGGNLVLSGQTRMDNYFLPVASSYNSLAGAELLWNARKGLDSKSQVAQLMNAISNDIDSGNFASASRSMAASVGSTVTSLLSSQRGDFRQQQLMIRNRTAQMGVNQGYINEDMPYFNAWVQGNGSYDKLNTSGDDSGYSLSTWGGTAGFDIDLNPSLTVGAAFTASYGKLKAQAADTASGDMDSYYVNLFARLQQKKWSHTLIATGGWNDASLDRSVLYSGGGYSTRGDTSGSSVGIMYEGTYDIALNQKKTSIFQPLVNVSILTSSVDGYSETGAGNASLSVDEMDSTTGTIALGARLMGIVGTNLFGRGVLGEVRAQVSQDMGDDRAVGRVGYQGIPGNSIAIRGAKRGSTGVQLGAGIHLPVGQQGTIFADANTDIRSGASSVNGTIGYRYNF